jgi:outer membrane protein
VKRIAILVTLVVIAPVAVAAQDPTDRSLTLSAAVDLALANHPAQDEARAGATAASGEVGVARSAYLPRLDLLWQTNHATRNNVFGLLLPQFVVPPVSGPVLGDEALGGVWSSAGGFLLSWEAVDFGRRGATVDVARAEAEVAAARRRMTDLEVASVAADAYLAVLVSDAALTAARANVQRLETFAGTVRTLVQNQLRAGIDLSRADAELAAALNRAVEAERDAELARLTFAEALGAPGTRFAVHSAGLPPVPTPAVETTPVEAGEHPQVTAVRAQADVVRARDRLLDRSNFPRVELQAAVSGRSVSQNVDGTSNGSGLGLDVPNWAVGATVTVPTLEIFRTQARRRVEAARLEEATARHERTTQALQAQKARARAVTSAAYRLAANMPRQLQAAADATTQATARYDAGLASVLEVADAQRSLAQAEAESAAATLAVWRARLAEAVIDGDVTSFVRQFAGSPPAVTR